MSYTLPNLLTHYTDLSGLKGILQHREIWCSNIHFLNDSKEYIHGVGAVIAAFRAATNDNGNSSPELRAFVNAGLLTELEGLAAAPTRGAPYIASFSTLSDDLSQWRGYGGDPGVCVRFDGQLLASNARQSDAFLFPCFYDEKNLLAMVESTSDVAHRQQLGAATEDVDSFAHALRSGLEEVANYALKASCLFKAPAFASEHEWRIVCNREERDLRYRVRERILVPYVTVPFWPEGSACPIREVAIGPGQHQQLNEAAVRFLLDSNGMRDVIVNRSNVPFRKFS